MDYTKFLLKNMQTNQTDQIVIFGTAWCSDCQRARLIFKKYGIDYIEHDIDSDPEALEFVVDHNNGFRSVPTIVFPNGDIMVEPSNKELKRKLIALDFIEG